LADNSERARQTHDVSEAHVRAVAAEEADRVLVRFCRDRLDLDLDDSSALKAFRADIEFAHRGRVQMEARMGFWKVAYLAGVTAVISAIVTYIAGYVSALMHFGKPPQ
jgi:hypothetical protein